MKAIKKGLTYTEFTDDDGWIFKGKPFEAQTGDFDFSLKLLYLANIKHHFRLGYTSSTDLRIVNGPGIATAPEIGCTYVGQIKNNNPHGYGEATWTDGSSYKGNWKEGHHHGEGVAVYPNEGRFEGEFIESIREGKGIYYWLDGARYEGDYKQGEQDG